MSIHRRQLLAALLAGSVGVTIAVNGDRGKAQSTRTRYVSAENGRDDGDADGSETQPFATIGRAVSDAEPGDTILISSGEYKERIRIDRSGSQDRPIVLTADEGANVRIVKGGIQISADYVQIQGITIDDNDDDDEAGVFVYGGTGIVLRDLTVTRNDGGGVRVKPTEGPVIDFQIEGGQFSQNNRAGIAAVGSDVLVNVQIRNVMVEDNAADGIQIERASQVAIHGASVARNGLDDARNGVFLKNVRGASVQGVFSRDNGHNGVALRKSEDLMIARCVSIGNGHHGFDSIEGCARVSYINNVAYANGESNEDKGLYVTDTDEIRVVNNVFADNAGDQMAFSTEGGPIGNLMSDYNLVWASSGDRLIRYDTTYYPNLPMFQTETGHDLHSLQSDPGFIDARAADFRLDQLSPAIDSGLEFAGVTDGFAGRAPDIGAFEHGS